jgi:hexosaminidase
MKLLTLLLTFCTLPALASNELNLIPTPMQIVKQKDTCSLQQHVSISAPSNLYIKPLLSAIKNSGRQVKLTPRDRANLIIRLTKGLDPEAYTLEVKESQIEIIAQGLPGAFYATQTLIQLIEQNAKIPQLKIEDAPRYGWRGVMLDESRHFFGMEQVKLIMGVQANIWSEEIATAERLQFMTFPRLFALAESAWTPQNRKSYSTFKAALIPICIA